MKIDNFSVHTFYYTHNSFATMLKSLSKANVKQVELYANAPHLCEMYCYTDEERSARLKEKKKRLEEYGIRVKSIFIPTLDCPINIADENDEVRMFSIGFVKRNIEDAQYLGAESILLDSGYGLYDKEKSSAWERSLNSLKEITAYAEKNQVEVYIRPMGACTNLVNTAETLEEMLKEVGSKNLKACMDIGIMNGNGETLRDYTERFDNIEYVRIPNFGPEGELCEEVGLNRVTDLLKQMPGFEGNFVIEIGWERLDIPDSASIGIGKVFPKLLEVRKN